MRVLHITKGDKGGLDIISKSLFKSLPATFDQEIVFFDNAGEKIYSDFKHARIGSAKFKQEIIFVNFLNSLKSMYNSDIIHVHHGKSWLLFSPLFLFKNKVIYTFHGNFGFAIKKNIIQKIATFLVLNYCFLFSKTL